MKIVNCKLKIKTDPDFHQDDVYGRTTSFVSYSFQFVF